MPDTNPANTLDTNASEVRLNRFENAWSAWCPGAPVPRWQDHLPADDEPCSADLIFFLLQMDIECRIKAGMPALLAESYFEHPRLQRPDARLSAEQQVELIRWEYQQRWNRRDAARRAEYEAAFPQHIEALRHLKPRSHCPRCHKILVLEETVQTLVCPDCSSALAAQDFLPFVAETMTALVPPVELDLRRYELCEKLGGGGMGEVYRCSDPALGRDLAIKIMKADLRHDAGIERRFLREARITASLQHPGIVAIHNLGRLADGRLHYTMRLVRGDTFAGILKDEAGKPERLPYLLSIFEKICQAVAYAHSKHVLHRDLKPDNVMVGKFGEVQVMDWGLAKVLARAEEAAPAPEAAEDQGTKIHTEAADTPWKATRLGSWMGTPAYMPREQARGQWDRVDERADVFALGSILCQILTGKPAYTGENQEEVEQRARYADLAETWERLGQCPFDAALKTLCRECLAPEPADRPRSASVVAERVAAYQAEVQERLRRAEVERAAAVVKAYEDRRRRRARSRWLIALVLVLLGGALASLWQAVRATHAEKKAAAAAEHTKAVMSFFVDNVLSAGRPEGAAGGQGKDVSLRTALDRAEPNIAPAFAHTPLFEALIRNALGETYELLGDYPKAVQQHERVRELRQSQLGADHPEALFTCINLGELYPYVRRTKDAIALLEATRPKMEALFGEDDPRTLRCCNNLAIAYGFDDRKEECIQLHQQTLKRREVQLGEKHPDTLKSLNNLGAAYFSANRFDESIPLFKQALKLRAEALGEKHPDTLKSLNNLAAAYMRTSRLDEAIPLFEQTLEQRKEELPADHPDTLVSMANLGVTYRDAGHPDKAIPLLVEALERGRKLQGGLPNSLAGLPGVLAGTYDRAGQFAKAEPIYRDLLQQTRQRHGAEHEETIVPMVKLGSNLLRQQKYSEAETLLRDCLKVCETKQPNGWMIDNIRSLLSESLLGQKKYAEAEPLLVQGYQGMSQHQDKKPQRYQQMRLLETMEQFVQLYNVTADKEKAAEWRKKLEEAKAAQKKPTR